MDADLQAMCIHTLSARLATSSASTGGETLGTVFTFSAYLEMVTEEMRAELGTDKKVTHLIVTEQEILPEHRIYLSGSTSDTNNGKRPVHINPMWEPDADPTVDDPAHWEVFL